MSFYQDNHSVLLQSGISSSGIITAWQSDRIHSIGIDPLKRTTPPHPHSVETLYVSTHPMNFIPKQDIPSLYYSICTELGFSKCDDNARQLGEIFFSITNIDLIQDEIVHETFIRSNRKFTIRKQRQSSLVIVMKKIFIERGVFSPCMIHEQILQLNRYVLDAVVPGIIVNCISIRNVELNYGKPSVELNTRAEHVSNKRYQPVVVDTERYKVYLDET